MAKTKNNGIHEGETHEHWFKRINDHIAKSLRTDFENIEVGNCVLFANGLTSYVSFVLGTSFEVTPIKGLPHDPVLLYFHNDAPMKRSVFHKDAGFEPVGFYSGQLQTSLFD